MNEDILRVLLQKMEETQKLIATQLSKVIDDHEQRLRYVEKWIWRAAGMATILAYLVSRIWK